MEEDLENVDFQAESLDGVIPSKLNIEGDTPTEEEQNKPVPLEGGLVGELDEAAVVHQSHIHSEVDGKSNEEFGEKLVAESSTVNSADLDEGSTARNLADLDEKLDEGSTARNLADLDEELDEGSIAINLADLDEELNEGSTAINLADLDESLDTAVEHVSQDEATADHHLTVNRFPHSRVKAIMKMDPDTTLTSQESVYLIAEAAKLFVQLQAMEAYKRTKTAKRKTVQKRDFDVVTEELDCMAFLECALDW